MKKALIAALILCLSLPVEIMAYEKDSAPFVSDAESYTLEGNTAVFCPEERGSLVRAVKPGSAVIFPIENAERAEDLKNMKLFTLKWEMGQEFTSRPYIEYRMLYDETGNNQKGYSYVAVLPVLNLGGEQKANVRGSITLGPHMTGNFKRRFSFVIRDDGTNPYSDSYICEGRDFPLSFDDSTHQVTLLFGESAQFSVDASGQGNINVGFINTPVLDIMYSYPKYDLKYLRFTRNPVFDRIGELTFFEEKGMYIYEITPDGLKDLKLDYNEEAGGYVLKTRRLGDYVISPRVLRKTGKKPQIYNPPTGGFI